MRSPKQWDYRNVVAVAFVTAIFMDVLDITIVNVALPTIRNEFNASASAIEWVSTGYLLSLAVWIPASGWLGDRIGTKRVFLFSLAMFTLGSLLCGLAWNIGSLIAFRIVQGIGGGMLTPVGQALLYRAFPPSERARASSIFTIPGVLGPALGPVLGGIITTHTSWRWIFLINLPVGVASFIFSRRYLQEHREETAGPLDRVGFGLSALGFAALLFGLSEIPRHRASPLSVVPIALGIVLIGALVLYELRHSAPMLAFRLFLNRAFRIGNVVNFLGLGAFIGSMFLLPFFLQDFRRHSPQTSGLATFTQALGFMLTSRFVGKVYLRVGPRRLVVAGLLGSGLINLAFQWVDSGTNLWTIRLIMFIRGVLLPLMFIPLTASSFATISMQDTGRASSLFSTTRQLCSGVGVAVLGAILFTGLADGPKTPAGQLDAYHRAFLWVSIIYFAGALAAMLIKDSDAAATMRPQPAQAAKST